MWGIGMVNHVFGGLRGRLLRSFLLVILLSVGMLILITELASFRRVSEVGNVANRQIAAQLATLLADHYARVGSWDEVESLLHAFTASPTELPADALDPLGNANWRSLLKVDRLVVTDVRGQVVADSAGALPVGAALPAELAARSASIAGDNGAVGQLSLSLNPAGDLVSSLRALLRRILLGGGVVAGSLAVLLSIFLTNRVAAPVRELNTAAQQLAAGTAVSPIPIPSQDEIGELTNSFNEMAQTLAAQKRYRQQMVADIAHELRTPLSIMQLNVEGLLDGLQSSAQAGAALQGEIRALSRLIDDLRLLSTADAGGLPLEMEAVAIRPFLQTLVQTWRGQTTQLVLQADLSDEAAVFADRIRLAQVMNNLISNGLRYAPDGAQIEVGGRLDDGEIMLWVANGGAGIPPEALPHLFDRFYRVDGSRSRETGGTGLGLAIVQRLVALQNGRVWVTSTPNEKTTFFVALPNLAQKMVA